jgi:YVTN family beta-propeller protein
VAGGGDISTQGDGSSQAGETVSGGVAPAAAVRTFLIADVRGYTRFTHEHGDEAAGRLAARFAAISREAVVAGGGELIELRGDEALCIFNSARDALRAAVDLQRRFREPEANENVFPLPIGIGLDAGEATPVEGGFRGGALNTAARLCSAAAPGQILATETVVSLARRVDGIRYVNRRPMRLKGLEQPVRVIEVAPEKPLPPLPTVAPQKRRRPKAPVLAAGVIALALAVGAFAVFGLRDGPTTGARLAANALGAIDPEKSRLVAQLPLESRPRAVAYGGGYLWVANEGDRTLSRVDRGLHHVRTIELDDNVDDVAYGGGAVWAALGGSRAVAQINPNTLFVQKIPVGNGPTALAADNHSVWVANSIDGTISRIDPQKGSVSDTIAVGPAPADVALGAGSVWIASEETATVVQVNPTTRAIVQAFNVGNGPASLAVAGGKVWVANRQDGTVSRIDLGTGSVTTTVVGARPSAVTANRDAVWIANSGDATIMRIAPDTATVDATLDVGSSPSALTVARGRIWAASGPSPGAHRGGTLRAYGGPSLCHCADPAGIGSIISDTDISVVSLAYDGLVAYRRAPGIAGGTLVPNLAVRLPTQTTGAKTYTFQLRRGLRFANGAPVRATDFRYSIERVLTLNREIAPGFYGGIVGASACGSAGTPRCDLSKGIETDDAAGTVTVRLTKPDPDFLHKLALLQASVVPKGTPLHLATTRPIPGTGSYRVASISRAQIRLVRNRRFRVWAADARPAGYPDAIVVRMTDDKQAAARAVERGKADAVELGGIPPESWRQLLTSRTGRVHTNPVPFTFWFALNTRVPPFDDERVRQAVNYAADRASLIQLGGGPTVVGQPACQLLPPTFPAFRPSCPYTMHRNRAGTWLAPDMAKARTLVRASGTRGAEIEVIGIVGPVASRVASYFASLLRELGYRAHVRAFRDAGVYFAYLFDSRNRAQIGQAGLVADYLGPSNFLRKFSCSAFVRGSSANENSSEYCDPKLDAQMARAAALQTSNPTRANALWAGVEHALVARAVAVPITNPRNRVFVSERVGNYQAHQLWGTLFDQLWVR